MCIPAFKGLLFRGFWGRGGRAVELYDEVFEPAKLPGGGDTSWSLLIYCPNYTMVLFCLTTI